MKNYGEPGLKIGFEIHQQLNTRKKLFCSCRIVKGQNFPEKITRRIRAVPGERGNIDPAVLYEMTRGREFTYRFNAESACLVELDEEPAHEINEEALYIVLQACKMLGSAAIKELHVMRKAVADGSSVSGFQRTALVATGGFQKTKNKKIGIQAVCLEEDSAPALKDSEFRLDRLGVPLIEIATEPMNVSPEEAMEAAEAVGTLLRSLNVKRGIGSIRQDINVSIAGGERIEIKGFQELDKIADAIRSEVARQRSLLGIKEELAKRKAKPPSKNIQDVTDVFSGTESFVKKTLSSGKVVAGLLPGFAGILKRECGSVTFGRELSYYASVYGYGITHSDEDLGKYRLTNEFAEVRKTLHAGEMDVVFIVAGVSPEKAASAVLERAASAFVGVPKETRVAEGTGSRFTRPLPGSERMYPETDVPVKEIGKIRIKLPLTLEERIKSLKLGKDMAEQLARSEHYDLFSRLHAKFSVDEVTIATVLLSTLKELRRKGFDTNRINEQELEKLFGYVSSNRLPKSSITYVLEKAASGSTVEETVLQMEPLSGKELEIIIRETIRNNAGKNESVIMGLVMAKVRGRAEGSKVSKALREMLEK